jgi:NAD-dependent SIR2 family protein deacetylase|tara:strand:- start:91 stop:369 length:279 start_codon:yes stop_codon:yes gene_type:complete
MKEQVILKVDRDEFDLIKKWGTNFVLMTKSGFIHSRKLTMQKSQQLLDGLDKQPNDEIEVLEKIHEEKKQLDRERKNKDNPYGQIGETYGGD